MEAINITTLTKKGQVTIPKRIREYLGIKSNDKIEFEIRKGKVEIRPALSLDVNFGRVTPSRKPENFNEMRRFFERKVGEEVDNEG